MVVACVVAVAASGAAHAELQQSASYSLNESEVGAGGDFTGASSHYSYAPGVDDGGSSLGETAVGTSSSTNYSSGAGFNTTAQPGLTFIVNTATVNLGALSTSVKATGVATFSAINYTTYGYVITAIGTPPKNGSHALTPLTTDTASSVGTEQFGVNTVLNTSAAVGANPAQVPSGSFSYGVAGDGVTGTYGTTRPYTISDKWRFNSGEVVASAPKSSGETDYTMTFLANMSTTTPGGKYTSTLELVATGTY